MLKSQTFLNGNGRFTDVIAIVIDAINNLAVIS